MSSLTVTSLWRKARSVLATVADLPVPDVVAFLFLVLPDDGSARPQGLEGVHHHGQGFVLHLNGVDAVGSGVPVGGQHRGHLLTVELDGIHGQHHLGVAHQGGHPGQVVLFQVLSGDNRQNARESQGFLGVDALDPGVGHWTAHDVQVEHPRELEVIDIVAFAPDEAWVLLAGDRVSHATDFGRCSRSHYALLSRSFLAADW